MEFDCKRQHSKCKAICCGIIVFEKDFWEKHQDKVTTNPVEIVLFPDSKNVMPRTESGYCAFLREDHHCNIYDERPDICRKYGDESTPHMSCPYLKKDGTERSRQQRRAIQRIVDKGLEAAGKRCDKLIQLESQKCQ